LTTIEWAKLLINLFGMVGTVAAALVAMISSNIAKKTLKEHKAMNERALKPLIVPKVESYQFKYKYKLEDFYKIDWGNSTEKIRYFKSSSYQNTKIQLLNLGQGTAKNIVIKSEIINYKEVIERINKSVRNSYNDELEINIIDDPYLPKTKSLNINYKRKNGDSWGIYPLNNFNTQKSIYIIGNSKENDVFFTLPSSFMLLYNLCLYTNSLNDKPENRVYPKLLITIECQDVSDKKYIFKYLYFYKHFWQKLDRNGEVMNTLEFQLTEYND